MDQAYGNRNTPDENEQAFRSKSAVNRVMKKGLLREINQAVVSAFLWPLPYDAGKT